MLLGVPWVKRRRKRAAQMAASQHDANPVALVAVLQPLGAERVLELLGCSV